MRRVDLIYEDALAEFVRIEPLHFDADVSERSTCSRLAYYLQLQLHKEGLSDYYADTEYNRKQDGRIKTIIDEDLAILNITADLIAHTRGQLLPPHDNLIAIEAKKISRPEIEKTKDRKRLRAMTMPVNEIYPLNGCHPEHVCGYKVGIFLIIDAEGGQLVSEFFKNGITTKKKVLRLNQGQDKAEQNAAPQIRPRGRVGGLTGGGKVIEVSKAR